MGPRRAPERIGQADLPDQAPDLLRDRTPPGVRSRRPAPAGAKALTASPDNHIELHNADRVQDFRLEPMEQSKQQPVPEAELQKARFFGSSKPDPVTESHELGITSGG